MTKPQPSEHRMKVNHGKHYSGLTRPPFTYTKLTEEALEEKGQLTLSEKYQWIL
jgi:hypothetical protein